MNQTSLSQVRNVLKDLGIRPSRRLGQSFLIDKNILDILIGTADLLPDDEVLEVGPGLGVVTERLLRETRRVTAIEKDRRLFDFLRERFKQRKNFDLKHGDMLDINPEELFRSGINKVVSNLPYSSGTRMLVDMIRARTPPGQIVITVQQEVAERLSARPGSREYSALSIWAQLIYQVDFIRTISSTCFWPKPEVKSAIINMIKRDDPPHSDEERKALYRLTKYAFSHRRKQLVSILAHAPSGLKIDSVECKKLLEHMGFDVRARPGDIPVDKWFKLTAACTAFS
ncbi:16S rRNA (adenine(1518)-N(6)/adenine(1519)-N(6))-dimethyltransferase RsmA [Verrucomicrobiota bacterium]